MCIISRGYTPQTLTKGLFVKSPLEPQKLRKNKLVYSGRKFCGFSRGFFKSPLKQGLERQFQHIFTIKKARRRRAFCVCIECWGICPKPRHKGLFEKSPLETQKLHLNKMEFCAKFFGTPFSERKV